MTRLAVLSDIHGNLPALEAVIDDMANLGTRIDQVVVAGDIINWGPYSTGVVERVIREGWPVIRGNNELYTLDIFTPRAPDHWNQFTISPWTNAQLGEALINRIATWPDSLSLRFRDAPTVRVVHGSPRSHFDPMHPFCSDAELAAFLDGVEETTVIAGHTHLKLDRHVGRWHLINSGTVGVPLDGDPRASYMLIEGGTNGWSVVDFRRVSYDRSRVYDGFAQLGFVEACGPIARLVIEEIETARCRVMPYHQWIKAQHPDAPTTDALVDTFLRDMDITHYTPPEYR